MTLAASAAAAGARVCMCVYLRPSLSLHIVSVLGPQSGEQAHFIVITIFVESQNYLLLLLRAPTSHAPAPTTALFGADADV
jgi:hypothetical protein